MCSKSFCVFSSHIFIYRPRKQKLRVKVRKNRFRKNIYLKHRQYVETAFFLFIIFLSSYFLSGSLRLILDVCESALFKSGNKHYKECYNCVYALSIEVVNDPFLSKSRYLPRISNRVNAVINVVLLTFSAYWNSAFWMHDVFANTGWHLGMCGFVKTRKKILFHVKIRLRLFFLTIHLSLFWGLAKTKNRQVQVSMVNTTKRGVRVVFDLRYTGNLWVILFWPKFYPRHENISIWEDQN